MALIGVEGTHKKLHNNDTNHKEISMHLDEVETDPDLLIDFMDLPTAVSRQSSLFNYYSEIAVDARASRDEALNDLNRKTAEVELAIRAKAKASGEKLTESTVSANVSTDEVLCSLKAAVVERNRELGKAEAKVRSLDHKRAMVEAAVRMVLSKSMGMSMSGVSEEYTCDTSQQAIRDGLNGCFDRR